LGSESLSCAENGRGGRQKKPSDGWVIARHDTKNQLIAEREEEFGGTLLRIVRVDLLRKGGERGPESASKNRQTKRKEGSGRGH